MTSMYIQGRIQEGHGGMCPLNFPSIPFLFFPSLSTSFYNDVKFVFKSVRNFWNFQ